jgi:hypothetical protein
MVPFSWSGLHPASIRAARRHLEAGAMRGGRSLADFPVVFVVTLGLGPDNEVGARWVRSWFQPDSRSSPTPTPQISAGWEKLDSSSMKRTIPTLFQRTVRTRLRRHLDCSARHNVAPTVCCGRTRRPAFG